MDDRHRRQNFRTNPDNVFDVRRHWLAELIGPLLLTFVAAGGAGGSSYARPRIATS